MHAQTSFYRNIKIMWNTPTFATKTLVLLHLFELKNFQISCFLAGDFRGQQFQK